MHTGERCSTTDALFRRDAVVVIGSRGRQGGAASPSSSWRHRRRQRGARGPD